MSRVEQRVVRNAIFAATVLWVYAIASEFPERECCDPVYPIPEPTSRAPSAPTPTGRSGPNIKTAVAILNCLFARQLCFEDPSCSAILEIIPRVCGPELVACSTVTVPKCQAALITLQAFPFFKPTCLCREPHVDPECNSFRDFLFDHPCVYVLKKDPFPVEPLPTCNHALSVCQRSKACIKLFEDFKTNCKARDGKCRMESRDACHDAWTQLRLSPMFGCICPNNHMKRRCDRIFSMVNHNPCVEFLPSATVDLSGTDSALYPFDPHQDNFQEFWFPPTSMYPYFLFPATATTRTFNEIEARYRYRESQQPPPPPPPPLPGAPELPGRRHGTLGHHDATGTILDRNRHHHENRNHDHRHGLDLEPDYDPAPHPHPHPHPSPRSDTEADPGPPPPPPPPITDDDTNSVDLNAVGGRTPFYEHDYASSTVTVTVNRQKHLSNEQHEQNRGHRVYQHNNNRHGLAPSSANSPSAADERRHSSSSSSSSSSSFSFSNDSHPQTQNRHNNDLNQHQHNNHRNSQAPPPAPAPAPDHQHHQHQHNQHNHHHHQHHHHRDHERHNHGKKFAPRPTYEHRSVVDEMIDLDDNELKLGGRQPIDRLFGLSEAFEGFVDKVKVISHPDNSTSFELIESQLENPLIDADHHDLDALKQIPLPGVHRRKIHHGKNHTTNDDNSAGRGAILPSPVSEADGQRIAIRPAATLTLTSTCHQAYSSCRNDPDCRTVMQPILNHCDLGSCARNSCMDAMQQFYRTAAELHTMEIAFCLCRKSDDKRDDCIVAQEKMHPVCAQRVEGVEMPTCHSLAEVCREDRACRARLEYYEQSCAVDSVTKKCAGAPSECRRAMIGILGTELRSNCACKGTDLAQLYDCLGWQRLLWVNPCVVESQKDFHARRKQQHKQRTTTVVAPSTGVEENDADDLMEPEGVEPIPEPTQKTIVDVTESLETTTIVTTVPTTTSTTTTSSTIPPRFCVVQRPRQSHQYIREGRGKRLYRDDEPECSELCQCGEGEVLVCNTICVESSPCKTDFAFYNHAAPAYQAYRGRCLCYSGRFICMRPFPDAYSIPHGVFMFLGYSEADENLLRPHSNLTVLDAVSSLDSFMRQEVDNQTVCTLLLYNVTKENVIAVAKLRSETTGPANASGNVRQTQNQVESQAQTLQQLMRIKDECAEMLRDLSNKINNKHHEVHTHPLLSIFKMAEVEVRLPLASGSNSSRVTKDPFNGIALALLLIAASFFVTSRSNRATVLSTPRTTINKTARCCS
ncbi:uncharacterized protein LOC105684340 isoform X1 [Athalia rosae]|uniref:uncharacterized protein LOC105684340 isoform X1 n=1 Tax=Athalia rosae TaxID=37344 RepID=UPI002033DFBC|nr:uncharacterized protein LOC105684340 isoform X1 [Athalia rosae]